MGVMQTTEPDDLFERADGPIRPFVFDDEVARVFPDMARRSVPGYAELLSLSGAIARRVARPGTACYDLGCSLGAVTFELLRQTPPSVRVVAVDRAPAMIAGLRARLAGHPEAARVETREGDLVTTELAAASLAVLNLTLQFVPPERRLELLERLRLGLAPGGALILAEKIQVPDHRGGDLLTALHEDFKRANGYSELAIARKRAALEQVLVPDPPEAHERRLAAAGFGDVTRWFQHLNFVAWVAWT